MSAGALLLGAWLSASTLAVEPVELAEPAEVDRQVEEILGHDRYYFCASDNSYVPTSADLRWCAIAAAGNFERCPGYAAVCARVLASSAGELPTGEETSTRAEHQRGKANDDAYDDSSFELPDLGVFAQILMWLLLLGGALAIALLIAKNLVRGRSEREPAEDPEIDPGESLVAARAAVMREVETDVQRLLARAEQAAARDDHDAAINDAYAALLRRLEGEQLITVDRWKTNGDYLHGLRPRPALRDELREIIREVEQVQFGAAPAEAGRYQRVRAKVLAIVSRATLAFALLLGAGTQIGCPLFDDPDERPGSSALAGLGTGPFGNRAVGDLLIANGIKARHRTGTITQLAQTSGAIVLLDDVNLHDDDWDALLTWVADERGTLIIATGQDFPSRIGVDYASTLAESTWLSRAGFDDFNELDLRAPAGRVLDLRVGGLGSGLGLLAREPELDGSVIEWDSEFDDTRSYAVERSLVDGGRIIVFAEPDLLTNAGISVADNATFLVNLFHSRGIDELEFINRYRGADDPFETVSNAKLSALFLQILLFLALLYAGVGIPFARLRDPAQQRRRSFSEHVETLGQRYAQARAAHYVASLYSAWVLDRLRDRLQPGAARGLHPLAVAIAARTGREEGQVMQLLVAVHDLRENTGSVTRGGPAKLELMRQLAKLLDETGA